MDKYTIYSDIHIGHPFEIKQKLSFTKNTVFLGDNFDIKNALRKDVKRIVQLRKETIEKCKRARGIYISGNHSLLSLKDKNKLIFKVNKILFIHGDIIEYGDKLSNLYRSFFSPGKGKLYWYSLKYWRKIHQGHSLFKKRHMERAIQLAINNNCNTIVMGHFHPKRLIDIKVDGIRIVVVPRGKTQIKL